MNKWKTCHYCYHPKFGDNHPTHTRKGTKIDCFINDNEFRKRDEESDLSYCYYFDEQSTEPIDRLRCGGFRRQTFEKIIGYYEPMDDIYITGYCNENENIISYITISENIDKINDDIQHQINKKKLQLKRQNTIKIQCGKVFKMCEVLNKINEHYHTSECYVLVLRVIPDRLYLLIRIEENPKDAECYGRHRFAQAYFNKLNVYQKEWDIPSMGTKLQEYLDEKFS